MRAASPIQISSCEKTRDWHNVWVVMGAIFGALSGVGGLGTTLATDSNVKLGIGIGSGASGAIGTLATALAGVEAAKFSTDNCQVILQQAQQPVADPR
jgi:hypothetical protein